MSLTRDVTRAAAQMGDRAFRSVLLRGVGATLLVLGASYGAILLLLDRAIPEELNLPWIGPVTWIDDLASFATVPAFLLASVFLMIPVASFAISFLLDDVTDAVEARHYAHLPPAPRLGLLASAGDALGFLGVLLLGNAAALIAYLLLPPAAPLIFLSLNGYLLGREYFQLIAARRLGREGAARMRRRHAVRIWIAGVVMALPLLVPVANLLVPVLGAATFTHLYHRLPKPPAPSGRTSPDRAG
ncbi:EI24 domain-containing protein [Profundibacterium mesophilum]|uniref:CysZ-like protein n=1 Tax=Profundibacterium mesophilum KAUST100406-0324 TaxID=1037889 RepID=A0A921TDC0_9RHOB|nr:EI24 domain-containing protein [Profundibacterium mesophilum]KAF0676633.1 CysZ-like protein [Profundibacterium mesophilum KAUST100406-0324]